MSVANHLWIILQCQKCVLTQALINPTDFSPVVEHLLNMGHELLSTIKCAILCRERKIQAAPFYRMGNQVLTVQCTLSSVLVRRHILLDKQHSATSIQFLLLCFPVKTNMSISFDWNMLFFIVYIQLGLFLICFTCRRPPCCCCLCLPRKTQLTKAKIRWTQKVVMHSTLKARS